MIDAINPNTSFDPRLLQSVMAPSDAPPRNSVGNHAGLGIVPVICRPPDERSRVTPSKTPVVSKRLLLPTKR